MNRNQAPSRLPPAPCSGILWFRMAILASAFLIAMASESFAGIVITPQRTWLSPPDTSPFDLPIDASDDLPDASNYIPLSSTTSGTTGTGATAGVAAASAAIASPNCEVALSALIARLAAERSLLVPMPPTSELLRPPKATGYSMN